MSVNRSIALELPCSLKPAALGVSLVLSALLTAAALRLADQHWLAWFSFLPLFVVIRSLRPLAALALPTPERVLPRLKE